MGRWFELENVTQILTGTDHVSKGRPGCKGIEGVAGNDEQDLFGICRRDGIGLHIQDAKVLYSIGVPLFEAILQLDGISFLQLLDINPVTIAVA